MMSQLPISPPLMSPQKTRLVDFSFFFPHDFGNITRPTELGIVRFGQRGKTHTIYYNQIKQEKNISFIQLFYISLINTV